jgi:hypothetical protein
MTAPTAMARIGLIKSFMGRLRREKPSVEERVAILIMTMGSYYELP